MNEYKIRSKASRISFDLIMFLWWSLGIIDMSSTFTIDLEQVSKFSIIAKFDQVQSIVFLLPL